MECTGLLDHVSVSAARLDDAAVDLLAELMDEHLHGVLRAVARAGVEVVEQLQLGTTRPRRATRYSRAEYSLRVRGISSFSRTTVRRPVSI